MPRVCRLSSPMKTGRWRRCNGIEAREGDVSKFLIDERPLTVQPTLCAIFGITRAVILQEIHWLLNQPRSGKRIARVEVADGRSFSDASWIWNTAEQWREFFSWLPADSIRKHLAELEAERVLVSYQRADRNRTKHYTIDYDALNAKLIEFPSGKNCRMQAAENDGCIRQPIESLHPAKIAGSSITQKRHTEMTYRDDGERASRAAPADVIPVPDALKNQTPPKRKARAPRYSSANITESDDERVALYLSLLRPEITPTNASAIQARVSSEHLNVWHEICERWAIAGWQSTNFAGMFDAYDRAVNSARVRAMASNGNGAHRQTQPAGLAVLREMMGGVMNE